MAKLRAVELQQYKSDDTKVGMNNSTSESLTWYKRDKPLNNMRTIMDMYNYHWDATLTICKTFPL